MFKLKRINDGYYLVGNKTFDPRGNRKFETVEQVNRHIRDWYIDPDNYIAEEVETS